jgi:hypothetical protein
LQKEARQRRRQSHPGSAADPSSSSEARSGG